VLTCTLNPTTRGMVNDDFYGSMKPRALLVRLSPSPAPLSCLKGALCSQKMVTSPDFMYVASQSNRSIRHSSSAGECGEGGIARLRLDSAGERASEFLLAVTTFRWML
jgi:hypothetical protein